MTSDMFAPEIQSYIHWLENMEHHGVGSQFLFDEKSHVHLNDLFKTLQSLDSLLHTLSRWILEKSSRSDSAMMTLPKIETLERIDQKYLAEHLDETLDRVRKENIALVITRDGKDDLVLCPQSWVSPMVDDEFGCVVNSAIRHALRSDDSDSSGVLHFVLKNYKLFDERTLAVAISDIERDLDYPLFPVSSSESWLEIKELLSVWLKDLQAAKYRKGVQNDGEQR